MLFTEEQQAIRDMAMRFARETLQPGYIAREKHGGLDRDLICELGRLGFLGADLPENLGGLGTDSIMVGLIAVVIIAAVVLLGGTLEDVFTSTNTEITNGVAGAGGEEGGA